ncbi:MAG: ABC transporter permease [Bacteroidota bacterium]|nr:ABC transporter permease [Bacteroidota bacterium]
MNKISLIIKREFFTRVRKKSFIVMTILGPLLFAAMMIVPAWLSQLEDTDKKVIAVIDDSEIFNHNLPETDYIKFIYLKNESVKSLQKDFSEKDYYAILYISELATYTPKTIQLFSDQQPNIGVKSHIENSIEKLIEGDKLKAAGIDKDILKSIDTNISVKTIQWNEEGEEKESSTEIAMAVGYISGFMIYFFIFLFGAQVMRGVIEEKTSRIVEIIISSAKPFQLMMGKIIGIALVGLTQFLLWIVLTTGIVTVTKTALYPDLGNKESQEMLSQNILESENISQAKIIEPQDTNKMESIITSIQNVNFGILLGSFIFYFLGGYLLYGSLFAAVGSAVDNETDTQQFMLPITIPLILAMFVMINAIQNPHGDIAFWFSMIPFTSPIVMMVRIPFEVPAWELALSMSILVITFIGSTWLAAKIYRTGILMYGKKINYKELWKWIRYKY